MTTVAVRMSLKEYPVWTEGVAAPSGEQGPPPDRADVVIVGGGISGLAAARELARRTIATVLFESHTLGWGASSRNGGMVLTGLKLDAATLVERYGLDRARQMFNASLEAIALVERIVAEERIDCHFERCGHLVVASKPSHYRALADEVALLERDFGHCTQLIPPERLREEIGSQAFYGGWVDPVSAGVHPARYVAGLTEAAGRAGAQLFGQTPVVSIKRHPKRKGSWLVRTSQGSTEAGHVFVATGGYTGAATPLLRRRVIPIGSYIIATEPLPEALAQEISPRGRMIYDTRNFLYYFRLTPDRRMLFGGRAGFFPETPTTVRASADILRRGMVRIFPQLRDVGIAYAWGGNVDFTFDMMPHAGTVGGLHYAMGYAGHGVALATYFGTQMGAALAGDNIEFPFEQPLPGAPLGLYDGRPWFLPFAGAWYKLLDWLT
jgi:glycine/D-amino acid oxidase-like deaminating enzyme